MGLMQMPSTLVLAPLRRLLMFAATTYKFIFIIIRLAWQLEQMRTRIPDTDMDNNMDMENDNDMKTYMNMDMLWDFRIL